MAVTHVFREFGPVFVKIRRDAKQMPFAFCQYTRAEDAARAITEGRGRSIKGRPCRTEKAKAHRKLTLSCHNTRDGMLTLQEFFADQKPGLFFIERKYGNAIHPAEARELLGVFGTIDFCRIPSDVERTTLNLNDGVIVEFEMYDQGQLAVQVSVPANSLL